MCSAVNEIDASGLESLEAINHRLADAGIGIHLSEVKGPVMDRLKRTHFVEELNGQVFLSQNRAFRDLAANGGAPEEPIAAARAEDGRVWTECVSPCRCRGAL